MTELKVRMNPKKHSGYIECRRLNKIVYITIDAIPNENCGFICDCGNWCGLDPYYHSYTYKGVIH